MVEKSTVKDDKHHHSTIKFSPHNLFKKCMSTVVKYTQLALQQHLHLTILFYRIKG